jgi:hypothetical protein
MGKSWIKLYTWCNFFLNGKIWQNHQHMRDLNGFEYSKIIEVNGMGIYMYGKFIEVTGKKISKACLTTRGYLDY